MAAPRLNPPNPKNLAPPGDGLRPHDPRGLKPSAGTAMTGGAKAVGDFSPHLRETGDKLGKLGSQAFQKTGEALTGEKAQALKADAGRFAGQAKERVGYWAELASEKTKDLGRRLMESGAQTGWRRIGMVVGVLAVVGGLSVGGYYAWSWWDEKGWRYTDPDEVTLEDWSRIEVFDYVKLSVLAGKLEPLDVSFAEGLAMADICPKATKTWNGWRMSQADLNRVREKEQMFAGWLGTQDVQSLSFPIRIAVRTPVPVATSADGSEVLVLTSLGQEIFVSPECPELLPEQLPAHRAIRMADTDHGFWLRRLPLVGSAQGRGATPVTLVLDVRGYDGGIFQAVPVAARIPLNDGKVQYAGYAEQPADAVVPPEPADAPPGPETDVPTASQPAAPVDWTLTRPINSSYTATGTTKVRMLPSTQGAVVDQLSRGKAVLIEGETNRMFQGKPWYKLVGSNAFVWSGLMVPTEFFADSASAPVERGGIPVSPSASAEELAQAITANCPNLPYKAQAYCQEMATKVQRGQKPTDGLSSAEKEEIGRYALRGPWGCVIWRIATNGRPSAFKLAKAPPQNTVVAYEIKVSTLESFGGLFGQ